MLGFRILKNLSSVKNGAIKNNAVVVRTIITKRKMPPEIPRNLEQGRKKITPFGWVLLAAPITTFGLGCWQVQRKTWKESLIKQMEQTMNMEPQPLPDDLDHLQTMEYHTVAVRGHFIHEREMYLGPRSLIKPDSDDAGGGLMSTKNTSGYLVITPFKLEDREETILVNRGWVSRQHVKPESRPQGQVQGAVEIHGVVRHPEPRPQFSPDHRSDIFLYRDVPRMCQLTGADPIYLDARTTFPGGPIGGQTRVTLRNEHMSYIVTWFSLSAFTSYFWWKQVVKRVPF